jgi:hypothetical protein
MSAVQRMKLSGVVDTGQTVLANINKLASSSQSFLTWDPTEGKWVMILNRGLSTSQLNQTRIFDDSNIIGSINLTNTGINNLYNSIKLQFLNKDQGHQVDERVLEIPLQERFAQELDNELTMRMDLIDDPVVAELLAAIEIKQNRLDKVIQFFTDFRAIELKAGDVIRVSNDQYFENSSIIPKPFRIVSIEEIDTDEGGLILSITALEYSASVYNEGGLTRQPRLRGSGIAPIGNNVCIIEKNNVATGKSVGAALQTPAGRAAITGAGVPIIQSESIGWTPQEVIAVLGPGSVNNTDFFSATWTIFNPIKNIQLFFEGPQGNFTYSVDGVQKTIDAGIPVLVSVEGSQSGEGGPWTLIGQRYLEWSTYTTTFNFEGLPAGLSFRVKIQPLNTFDLNAADPNVDIVSVNQVFSNIVGDAAAFSFVVFLN